MQWAACVAGDCSCTCDASFRIVRYKPPSEPRLAHPLDLGLARYFGTRQQTRPLQVLHSSLAGGSFCSLYQVWFIFLPPWPAAVTDVTAAPNLAPFLGFPRTKLAYPVDARQPASQSGSQKIPLTAYVASSMQLPGRGWAVHPLACGNRSLPFTCICVRCSAVQPTGCIGRRAGRAGTA